MEYTDKFRLYGLVPYNISPIQQGIQYGHALQEMNNFFREHPEHINSEDFYTWSKECKTFIILNGGTTNNRYINDAGFFGSLNNYAVELDEMGIQNFKFEEPDLGDQLTAVVFLVPEQVYNKKDFPEFWEWKDEDLDRHFESIDLIKFKHGDLFVEDFTNSQKWVWEKYVDFMGGEKNLHLRYFLRNFKLA